MRSGAPGRRWIALGNFGDFSGLTDPTTLTLALTVSEHLTGRMRLIADTEF
jgi:hypothetical protein